MPEFAAVFDLSTLDGTNGFRLDGIDLGDRCGTSVSSAGDVNGDGFDDVIVGAFGADPGGDRYAGESYVVFGKALGFASVIDLASLGGNNGFRLGGIDAYDYSGRSVASAGDVNGDGFDDVIIGAHGGNPGGAGRAGESYVVFGNASGFAASIDLGGLDGSNGFRLDGIDALDESGRSVASAGDVNGDGFDDLIVGARYGDPGGDVTAGESYVVFGNASGFAAAIDLNSLNGGNGFRIDGIDASDLSGFCVASAGDVNGDGFADLIVGAPSADPGGDSAAGESYLVFGKASGFDAAIDLAGLNGSNGFRLDGIAANDRSGFSVASAGDVNGDGFDDVIVGSPVSDPGGVIEAGESYVVFGKASAFASGIDLAGLDGTNGFRLEGIDSGDFTGRSVSSAGDVNGDGFTDLIVAASRANPDGVARAGESYVVFGKASGFAASFELADLDGANGFRLDGIDFADYSGYSLAAAGDVNGDGFDDVIVGTLNGDAGESYVIFGHEALVAVTRIGTAIDNRINGGVGDDAISGLAGNDTLFGRRGNDVINGGSGDDDMFGGAGDDKYFLSGSGDRVIEAANKGNDTVVVQSDYSLGNNVENLVLGGTGNFSGTGNALDNAIRGNGGANSLFGLDGDDTLDGGDDNDTMTGGLGDDTYVLSGSGDAIVELAGGGIDTVVAQFGYTLADQFENLTIGGTGNFSGTGNAFGNSIKGNGGANALLGLDGDDTLDGGAGNDTMTGGLGDDTYILSGSGDAIVELAGGGIDTVIAQFDLVLGDQLENLNIVGTGNFSGTGNSAANGITGNGGRNALSGLAGNDVLSGLDGDDTLDGGAGNDTMTGGLGDDTYILSGSGDAIVELAGGGIDTVIAQFDLALGDQLEDLHIAGTGNFLGTGNSAANGITGNGGRNVLSGLAGNDVLWGLDGDDTLDGGAGNDTMTGGLGDDTYVLSGHGDVIVELAGGGSDTAAAEFTYTLLGQVENLVLDGTRNISGTGNSLANAITGNSGRNALSGVAGDDRLEGNGGDDTLDGGNGADLLLGGDGNDRLDGGLGNDAMAGGKGNDTYTVNALGDTVTELANQGIDLVFASVRHTLGANVENLTLTGTANIGGTGNGLANAIAGNGGANTLTGLGGADDLDGGAGTDILVGGAHGDRFAGGADADTFRYTSLADSATPAGRDRIEDFAAGEDTIDLKGLGFDAVITGGFTGAGGELRVATGANTLVFGDVDGDKTADFYIQFVGAVALTVGDFVL